jgi:hypothetical protein
MPSHTNPLPISSPPLHPQATASSHSRANPGLCMPCSPAQCSSTLLMQSAPHRPYASQLHPHPNHAPVGPHPQDPSAGDVADTRAGVADREGAAGVRRLHEPAGASHTTHCGWWSSGPHTQLGLCYGMSLRRLPTQAVPSWSGVVTGLETKELKRRHGAIKNQPLSVLGAVRTRLSFHLGPGTQCMLTGYSDAVQRTVT